MIIPQRYFRHLCAGFARSPDKFGKQQISISPGPGAAVNSGNFHELPLCVKVLYIRLEQRYN
jgi:hypothetical protein